ncbi:alkaline phosphatase family protein [PVC group bacterium]|nr:alkaline phosphatase family protein [PVC group bacterium]
MLPLGYIDPGTGFTIVTAGGGIFAALFGFFGGIFLFFRKHPLRGALIILCLTLLLGLGYLGIVKMLEPKGKNINHKIIILGFDALDTDVIEKLMSEDKLPNFSRLKESGGYRHLATTNPSLSPVAWSTFATGQNPGKHGVYDFIRRDPIDYSLSLGLMDKQDNQIKNIKKTPSWWTYTSKKGISHVILQCPITFPPDKIKGKMLSGMGVPDILGTQGTFSFFTTQSTKTGKDVGGRVYLLDNNPVIETKLIGTRIQGWRKTQSAEIPFVIERKNDHITIKIQNKSLDLRVGEISSWIPVIFQTGLFRKIRGIVKFVLTENHPELGLYVSPVNFDPISPLYPISHPSSFSRTLFNDIGYYHTQGMPFDTWALNEKRISEEIFLGLAHEIFETKKKMLFSELKKFNNGIFYCYFEDADILQHMFTRFHDPEHPLFESHDQFSQIIDNIYIKLDKILGQTMKYMTDQDILLVLSDHGFETFRRAAHVNSWLREKGYLHLKDSTTQVGRELLEDIDWNKTMAYALGFGAVYINQVGREGQGIVKPGRPTEDLKNKLVSELMEWTDQKNGAKIIKQVYRKEDIFLGPYMAEAPDLYIGFARGYRASWQTAMGAVPRPLVADNLKKWSGDHLCDPALVPGVLFANRPIVKTDPALTDFAATILKLCGFTDEEIQPFDFDGISFLE